MIRLPSAAMDGCAFCAIVERRAAADLVFESDDVVAFLDHRPLFPGHVLVVPRSHVETVEDLPDDLGGALMAVVRRTSAAVRRALDADGSFVAANNRVSQSVPHLHFHVVPRRPGDGLRGFFWPRHPYRDDAHREQVREAIARVMAGS
jgi:histidine triad (HIT) family protein